MVKCIFSVDVEEWFMAENIRPHVGDLWKTHSSIHAFETLLDILSERKIVGTFFVVGNLLRQKKYTQVMKRAIADGHEVGSHSMNHRILNNLSFSQTKSEVGDSVKIISDKLGIAAKGFRSPCFSTNVHLEECLVENNIVYTSNGILASLHDRYGSGMISQKLPDIPIPTFRLLSLEFPITGGGWFRMFPIWWQKKLLNKKHSFMFYCHPWDFDKEQPRLRKVPIFKKFRHNVNVGNSKAKLLDLLSEEYHFLTAASFIQQTYNSSQFALEKPD